MKALTSPGTRAAALAERVTERAARRLEQGVESPFASRASWIWARAARVRRPLALPRGAAVIGVGGPTLGGCYKTPLTLGIARALSLEGARVAVASHGYRAGISSPSRVDPGALSCDVGDEALWLARELSRSGVPVFSGRNRAEVLANAARAADVVVADSLLQTAPERLALSILVVDGDAPWGAGWCPPRGDLRAPREELLSAADVVVAVSSGRAAAGALETSGLPIAPASSELHGAYAATGVVVSMAELAGMRVGVVLAIARPERVMDLLGAHGISPVSVRTFPDHRVPREPESRVPGLDAWVTTGKCASKLGSFYGGAPLLVLDHRVKVREDLAERLRSARAHPHHRA